MLTLPAAVLHVAYPIDPEPVAVVPFASAILSAPVRMMPTANPPLACAVDEIASGGDQKVEDAWSCYVALNPKQAVEQMLFAAGPGCTSFEPWRLPDPGSNSQLQQQTGWVI
jgi:hypothetical protein